MKKLILAATILLSLTSALANTCKSDPEDTIARKINETIPETLEDVSYPSARNTFSYIEDHEDKIKNITLFRGNNFRADIRIHLNFKDGSDANILFNVYELGNSNMKNVFLTINSIARSKQLKADLSYDKLSKIMKSKTLTHLTAKTDYLDQETELGSKVALERCTLELDVRVKGAKMDSFTAGAF
jgi:hypothetical protein